MSALNREETDRIGMGHQQEACEQSENEGFFRSLIQYAPNVVIFLSPDHRILEFNPEAERLYGRKRADVLGKNYLELFLPDDVREVVAADIEKVLTGEASRGFENIIIAQDGRERILSWNVDRVLDSDNKAVGIVAISQDITEGRKTDQALRESEDKYRSLVAHIPDVVWSTDHEGRTTFISPNVERAYGYTPEEIYQEGERLWFERIHPDDAERVKEAFEGVFEKGEQLDVEYRIKRKDGEWIWLRDRSVGAYEKDGKKYADGVFSDITEKKRSEEHALHYQKQLQNEKAFGEAIIDSLPASFYMFDEQGYYFRWNKMERDDRGATDEEMPRVHCLEGIMDEDRAVVQKAVEEVFKYGRGEVELREYSKPRGEYRTQLCTGTRVDIDGVPYLVGVGIDITERRLLEDKLRGSEERYRTLVERVNEMIFMHDPDYNLTYVSPQCEKMTGYTAQELIGQKWHSYATDNPVNRLAVDILAQAKQTGKSPEPHLVEVRKKDGELIILEVNDSILRDPEGDIIGVVGSARDITHQLMMEKALSKNEERLRYTLESTNDGIWDWNLQTDSVYWSPRSFTMLGYEPDEFPITYEVWRSLVHPDDLIKCEPVVQAALQTAESFRIEFRYRKKDGSWMWILGRGRCVERDADGKPLRMVGTHLDLTERKRAEAERARLIDILETTSDFVSTSTPDGELNYVNKAGKKMLGYREDEDFEGRKIPDAHPGWAFDIIKNEGIPAAIEQGVWEGETALVRSDGTELPASQVIMSHKSPDGQLQYLSTIIRDITERKLAERKLQEYQKQLKSLASELSFAEERERRRIAAGIHDDIAQKLAMAKFGLQSFRASVSNSELLGTLDKQCQLMDQIVSDARSLTFELSNPVMYEVGLEAAVESHLEQLARGQLGIECRFRFEGPRSSLGEEIKAVLFQAVRELLANVVKHANANTVEVCMTNSEDELRIVVEDDGVGFDPAGIGPHGVGEGGFGLFNIRERLEYFGGNLKIETGREKGARVIMAVTTTADALA